MRFIFFIFLLCYQAYGQNLDKYLWKNRVVIIFDSNAKSLAIEKQLKAFEPFSNEFKDRDMVILVPVKREREALLERFALKNDYCGLILIGKDGGIKLREKRIVAPKILFNLIDTMPMRKAELRNKAKKKDKR